MTTLTARQVVKLASDKYHEEGRLEIDPTATDLQAKARVSCADPTRGAYVQAWVWIDFPEGTSYEGGP